MKTYFHPQEGCIDAFKSTFLVAMVGEILFLVAKVREILFLSKYLLIILQS